MNLALSAEELESMRLCLRLQHGLIDAYASSIPGVDAMAGLRLPTGEVVREYGLTLVNPAIIRQTQILNQDPDRSLQLVDDSVLEEVKRNGICICVILERGSNTAQYYPLHLCSLQLK